MHKSNINVRSRKERNILGQRISELSIYNKGMYYLYIDGNTEENRIDCFRIEEY